MKVLHITNWYPTPKIPLQGLFIRESFIALQGYCDNVLVHAEVIDDASALFKEVRTEISTNERAIVWYTRDIPWRLKQWFDISWSVKEWLSGRLLKKILKEAKANEEYDLVNVHIAYPLLMNIKGILKHLDIPLVITEHWSAYRRSFGMPEKKAKLDQIRNIFAHQLPLITVSADLANDIKTFAGRADFDSYVVPNIAHSCFKFNQPEWAAINHEAEPRFFMVNIWRKGKRPLCCIQAFHHLYQEYPKASLRIGGDGPQLSEMQAYVNENGLSEVVQFLGTMSKEEIAKEMQGITAFLHASDYETFSVVNVEALCCGTPVVMSKLPAVMEYINESNGLLVQDNNPELWNKALLQITKTNKLYNRKCISQQAQKRFSQEAVGEQYYQVYQDILSKEHLD